MPTYGNLGSNTLGGDRYMAIEMAVKATGVGALRDLESAFQSNGQALANNVAAYRAGKIHLDEFTKEVARLKREQGELAESINAANRVLAGGTAALNQAKTGFNGLGQAAQGASRALEDWATGGWIGPLNNLPQIVRGVGTAFKVASPQIAVAETAVTALGTGALLVYQNWTTLKGLFDTGLGPKLVDDLKAVNEQIKTLTEKDLKLRIDVRDLENAKTQAKELQGIKAAIEAQKGPTKDETERGGQFNEAVKAAGYNKVTDAVRASMGPIEDSAATIEARRKLKEQQDYMASQRYQLDVSASLGAAVPWAESQLRSLKEQLENAKSVDVQNRSSAVERFLGQAGQGDEKSRQYIQDLFDRNRAKFDAAGVGQSFRDSIAKASQAEQAKSQAAAKAEKSGDAVEKEAAAIGDEPVKQVEAIVRKYRDGFIDRLEADMYTTLKAVPPADRVATSKRLVDAREKAIAAELSSLTGYGPTDMRSLAPARKLLEEGATGAQNAITSGQPPKLVAERERDQAKAVADEVKRLAPGVQDQIEKALLTRQARGANPEDAAAGVLPSLRDVIARQGLAGDKLDKVAAALLDKGKVGVAQDLAKLGPIPLQAAAQQQLMTVLDKLDSKLNADQKRAASNQNARVVQQFANAYQGMTGESDARSLDAGRRAAKWFGEGYTEDEAMGAAMAEMGEAGVQRGQRFDQLGRGGRPADKAARDAKAAGLKAQREAKKRADAEWHRRMGKGAGPAPDGNGGGLMSVPPSATAADMGGNSDPKAPAPSMGANSAMINSGVVGVLEQVTAVTTNLARQQDREGARFAAMMSHLAMVRQQQERNVTQLPSLYPSSPWIR